MDKNKLIEIISDDFKISIGDSKKIVDSIFDAMIGCFGINKNLSIPKLGEFKLISSKSNNANSKTISFIPAKKLSDKVNYYFNDLEKVSLQIENVSDIDDEFNYKMSDEFIKHYKENSDKEIIEIDMDEQSSGESLIVKPIISDKIKDLHNEIINPEKSPGEKKTNLWG